MYSENFLNKLNTIRHSNAEKWVKLYGNAVTNTKDNLVSAWLTLSVNEIT